MFSRWRLWRTPGCLFLCLFKISNGLRATAQGRFRPPFQKVCVYTQSCLKESVRSVFGVHPAVTIVPRPARDDFMKSIVLTGIMSWISVWCLGCIIMKLSQTHLFPNRLWAMDNMNKFIFRTTINPLLQCFPLFSFYVYNIQKPDIGKGIICY